MQLYLQIICTILNIELICFCLMHANLFSLLEIACLFWKTNYTFISYRNVHTKWIKMQKELCIKVMELKFWTLDEHVKLLCLKLFVHDLDFWTNYQQWQQLQQTCKSTEFASWAFSLALLMYYLIWNTFSNTLSVHQIIYKAQN